MKTFFGNNKLFDIKNESMWHECYTRWFQTNFYIPNTSSQRFLKSIYRISFIRSKYHFKHSKNFIYRVFVLIAPVQAIFITFYYVTPSDVISKYQGESEKLIENLFESTQKNKPSIYWWNRFTGLISHWYWLIFRHIQTEIVVT